MDAQKGRTVRTRLLPNPRKLSPNVNYLTLSTHPETILLGGGRIGGLIWRMPVHARKRRVTLASMSRIDRKRCRSSLLPRFGLNHHRRGRRTARHNLARSARRLRGHRFLATIPLSRGYSFNVRIGNQATLRLLAQQTSRRQDCATESAVNRRDVAWRFIGF